MCLSTPGSLAHLITALCPWRSVLSPSLRCKQLMGTEYVLFTILRALESNVHTVGIITWIAD